MYFELVLIVNPGISMAYASHTAKRKKNPAS